MEKISYKINDRIKEMIDNEGVSIRKFAEKVGVSHSLFGKSVSVGSDKLNKILEAYPKYNPIWLLMGRGDMIIGENMLHNTHNLQKHIPMLPIEAAAGFGKGDVSVMDYDTKKYIIPEFDDLKVDFLTKIKGSSMYPKYNSGDTIACIKVPMDTFFQWNRVYLLDTDQGPIVKRIKKSSQEGQILCISDNKDYDPFNLDLKHIRSIALVVGVIRLE